MTTSESIAEPYKGAYSYQLEDAGLFFGRERETGHLVAKVLGSRFTLLHARSGAGKSSLVNARLIPRLESRGLSVVRSEPGENPIYALQGNVLRTLLPPPEAELSSITQCMECFPEIQSLLALLEAFDSLSVRDARRRHLIRQLTVTPRPGLFSENDTVRPVFSKLLLSNVTIQSYLLHLAAIAAVIPGGSTGLNVDSDDIPIAQIISLLQSADYCNAYNFLTESIIQSGQDLTSFFQAVTELYGKQIPDFALVLIMDQFEELFTRFVDPGGLKITPNAQPLDWRIRRGFFDQLNALYQFRMASSDDAAQHSDPLPIRYVIAIRDDFLAQLEDIRHMVGSFEESMFHLNMLEPNEAILAIREPAKQFGYDYSENCIARIVAELTREERFVEPAHLSIVCSRLWSEYGRKISDSAEGINPVKSSVIHEEEFESLGGAPGIISSFFKSFLTGLDLDERIETVELLSRLITNSGTRNIVEQTALVNVPYRNAIRRKTLLANLIDNHGIVRAEYRFGGRWISITHEFLIEPIQIAAHDLLASNAEHGQLEWALEMLTRTTGMKFLDSVGSIVPADAFTVLNTRHDEIVWDETSIEVMLRSAIARQRDKGVVRYWIDRYTSEEHIDSEAIDVIHEAQRVGRTALSRREWNRIKSSKLPENMSADEMERVFRSSILFSDGGERDQMFALAKKLKDLNAA